MHLDDIAQPEHPLVSRASNIVHWTQRIGGVAANAACAATRAVATQELSTNRQVELMAAVGDDAIAVQLKQSLEAAGVGPRLHEFQKASTGRYTAIMNHDGELHIGLADVSLAERLGESEDHKITGVDSLQAVLVDANLSESYLKKIAEQTATHKIPLAAMSVSPTKSLRLLPIAKQIDVLLCNRREAISMSPHLPKTASLAVLADGLSQSGFKQFVLTDGGAPLLVQNKKQRVNLDVPTVESMQNVNGAGDALAGATFAAWANGMDLAQAVKEIGLTQAAMIVSGEYKAPQITAAVAQ